MSLNLKQYCTKLQLKKSYLFVIVFGLCLSSPVRAQTVSEASEKQAASSFQAGTATTGIEDVAFSLAIVLILIFALAWLVKRFAPGVGKMGNKHITVLSTMTLGNKERLMLVDVAGTQMVLGVSSSGIECLHVFPEAPIGLPNGTASSDVHFGKILQGFKANREKN